MKESRNCMLKYGVDKFIPVKENNYKLPLKNEILTQCNNNDDLADEVSISFRQN